MQEFISRFTFDFWTVWGLASQGMFFARFIVQWIYSERAKMIVVPIIFWYISLVGSVMVLIYAFARYDFVFLVTGILQLMLYSRNLHFAHKTRTIPTEDNTISE